MTAAPSRLFRQHGSDKEHPDGHSYGALYDELLIPVRETVANVLELGVAGGGSLRAWRDFFPNAHVLGLDNNPQTIRDYGERITALKCDVIDADQLATACGDRLFDVIVDDASHWEGDQLKSFELLRDRLVPGGVYVVEDIQCVESHDKFRAVGFTVFDMRQSRWPGRFDNVIAVYRAPTPA